MNDAYGVEDDVRQARGRAGTAADWAAQTVGERAASPLAGPPHPAPTPLRAEVPQSPRQRSTYTPDTSMPLRLVQVYLTAGIDEFLRQARSMAIVENLDLSASAVVRHAMEQLMAGASPAEMVKLLGSPKGQSQPRRGRPRR